MKNLFIFNFKIFNDFYFVRFVKKFLFFLTSLFFLILTPLCIEVFFLPETFFVKRIYESLISSKSLLQEYQYGQFYPSKYIKMYEHGDKQKFTFDNNKKKLNEWFTDSHGFRNRDYFDDKKYDVVITGDSMINGSYLDQKNIISEVLQRKCKCSVYNYGSMNLRDKYIYDKRFIKQPPKYAIFQTQFSYMNLIPNVWHDFGAEKFILKEKKYEESIYIYIDRLFKLSGFRFIKSRLNTVSVKKEKKEKFNKEDLLKYNLDNILRIKRILEKRNTKMILLILPSKIKVLNDLPDLLEENNLDVIWFDPSKFEDFSAFYENFFFKLDSHWREDSVELVSELLLEKIK